MDASQYDILSLFADGGLMMYPLVLCSLIALGVIIAKAWTLYVAHSSTQAVLAEVDEAAHAGRLDEALKLASARPGPAAGGCCCVGAGDGAGAGASGSRGG